MATQKTGRIAEPPEGFRYEAEVLPLEEEQDLVRQFKGSAYLLRGPSRTEWEHSIPAVETLRYSITFRRLRGMR
jgi:hypothetical protein